MAIFNQFPWTNFREYNLDWVISKVKSMTSKVDELESIVESALTDVSDAVASYFATHIDTGLTRAGDAADAAAVGQRLTTVNGSITSLSGQVGAINTSIGTLTSNMTLKANAVVIDADNLTYLQGSYSTLWSAVDSNKATDVWIKSGYAFYKAKKLQPGPNSRVIIQYDDYSIGADSDDTITSPVASGYVVIDFDNKAFTLGNYSDIKDMLDNSKPIKIFFTLTQNNGSVLCAARSIYQYSGNTNLTVFFVDYLDAVKQVTVTNNNVIS